MSIIKMVKIMLDNIIKKLNENPDFVIRKININNCDVTFLFFETLTSTSNINEFILKYTSYLKANKKLILNIDKYLSTYVPNFKIKKLDSEDDILTNLFSGFVIMCISNNFYSMEVRRQLDSGIEKASNEKVIKGPKDAFCENYQTNIGLIRKRIRTDALVLKELNVGKISKTKVGIMYDKDICDIKCVEKIITKIKSIDIDTIIDSNYIYEYIKEDKTLFPSVITTERPDLVSYKILNGKVAIVVENTPYVLLLPAFFIEFFHTMDDYYQNNKVVLKTDITTGQNNGTPTGNYKVIKKARNTYLMTKEYKSFVKYWIGFLGSNYGIHDASWRKKFGGKEYLFNGSHGCVNVPADKAAKLYSLIELGTPIYIRK